LSVFWFWQLWFYPLLKSNKENDMGLMLSVYRDASGSDCTNGGVSSQFDRVCVVNVDGPFNPSIDCPAVELSVGPGKNNPILVPVAGAARGFAGPMFGGNFAGTSDGRFGNALEQMFGVRFRVVPMFDRYESMEQYAANFN